MTFGDRLIIAAVPGGVTRLSANSRIHSRGQPPRPAILACRQHCDRMVVTFQEEANMRGITTLSVTFSGAPRARLAAAVAACALVTACSQDADKPDHADRDPNHHDDGRVGGRFEHAGDQPELAAVRGARVELPHAEQRTGVTVCSPPNQPLRSSLSRPHSRPRIDLQRYCSSAGGMTCSMQTPLGSGPDSINGQPCGSAGPTLQIPRRPRLLRVRHPVGN